MPLKRIGGQLCCIECDWVFDEKWHLVDGAQCPNVSCRSHSGSALGVLLSTVRQLNEQGTKNAALAHAFSGLVPARADSADAQDAAVLNNLKKLLELTAQTIFTIKSRNAVASGEAKNKDTLSAAVNADNFPIFRLLGHELDGAIIDIEQGDGFDDVCLGTMKRVRDALYVLSPAADRASAG